MYQETFFRRNIDKVVLTRIAEVIISERFV